MGEREAALRDLVIFILNGQLTLHDAQIEIVEFGNQSYPDFIDRKELTMLSHMKPQIISKIIEMDDLIEWKGDAWRCGFEIDHDFLELHKDWVQLNQSNEEAELRAVVEFWEKEREKPVES